MGSPTGAKPPACRGCVLSSLGQGFALYDGEGSSGVLVVAEALGEDEARTGIPLVGRAGTVWDRMVSRTTDPVLGRLGRSHFRHANVLSCRPPDNALVGASYEQPAIQHCRTHLGSVLSDFKPKCILTLGNVPLRWFTSHWGIEQLRGYIFETPWGPVVPTYHPSYIMRGKWNLARVVQLDILRAIEVAREGPKKFLRDKTYQLSPGLHEVRGFLDEWRAAGRPPLAFDIETPLPREAVEAEEELTFEDDLSYQILMCSLSFKPFEAISVPWIPGLKELVIQALSEAPTTLVWNAKFDVPRLSAAGVNFSGEIIDVMLAWHWLEPALPMGLKYVATFFCPDMGAWKLEMQKNFQWYNAADSDVLLRVYQGVQARLEAQGRWKTFLRHFVEFGKLLNRMTVRGITIDHARRAEARNRFSERFAGVIARADERAPGNIRSLHPKRGYKKPPKELGGLVQILVELTPEEEAKERERVERERKKAREQAEKAARKAERERKRAEKLAAKLAKAAKPRAPRAARKRKEA